LAAVLNTSPSRWNSSTTLIGVGVAFATSVVLAGHWWTDKPKLDLDSLGKQVTSGLQNEFDTADMKHYGLHVGDDIILAGARGEITPGGHRLCDFMNARALLLTTDTEIEAALTKVRAIAHNWNEPMIAAQAQNDVDKADRGPGYAIDRCYGRFSWPRVRRRGRGYELRRSVAPLQHLWSSRLRCVAS
jgi:hypothetical protein